MLLTFIIPVRHQDNAKDWPLLVSNLKQTVASITNQTNEDYSIIIVANHGAELPEFHEKVSIIRVDFSPNLVHDKGSASEAEFLDAFRLDKGRRVLEAMKSSKESSYFMIVDDDDLVSKNIVNFVSTNKGRSGWVIDKGYLWNSGVNFLLKHNELNNVCGTTLIIKSELYRIDENFDEYSEVTIKDMLGSHKRIVDILKSKGHTLEKLPFRGAIYRVAHSGSHSQNGGILDYINPRNPKLFLKNISKLRFKTDSVSRDFFG